jgi:RNA polymerase sigma-70 factor (ECF subfamily)
VKVGGWRIFKIKPKRLLKMTAAGEILFSADFIGAWRMETATSTENLRIEQVEARAALSDHELIAATCAGDQVAFEEIVNRYRNQITNFIFRMLNDYEEAVDLAQETFVRVYVARDRYSNSFAFSTYIYRIATNLAISELRKRKRRRLISLSGLFQSTDDSLIEFQPPDKKKLPDVELADAQLRQTVAKAIATLPEKYRAVLVLRDVEGKTYEEISAILATNEGTIKSRISRGRNLLREKLKKYFNR